MRRVNPPCAAFEVVVTKRPVDPLPKVTVLDGRHLPEMLPAPTVRTPLVETIRQPGPDVTATGDEGYARRLIERFQPADQRQQFQPLAASVRLGVARLQPLAGADWLQHEPPATGAAGLCGARRCRLGVEEKMGGTDRHGRTLGGLAAVQDKPEGRFTSGIGNVDVDAPIYPIRFEI